MTFDVFLSHNSQDKPAVRELKRRLVGSQLTVWIDEEQLRPGIPWQKLLEEGIRTSASVAVLVGHDGLGPWEDEEMQAALILAVKDKRPVIPVLLPGAAATPPELPLFLRNRTWVDLRGGLTPEGLDQLVWGITGKKPNPDGGEGPAALEAYRAWLERDCGGVELLGLQDQQGRAVQLYQIYVPLATTAGREPATDMEPEAALRRGRPGGEERPPELLLGRLATHSLYVSGAAGLGKSTFCRWVAYLLAAGQLPGREPAPPEGYAELFPEPVRDKLPLLVRLRDFWAALPDGPGTAALSGPELAAALAAWVEAKRPGGRTGATVRGLLDQGRLLLMLDGFDEVPLSVGEEALERRGAGRLGSETQATGRRLGSETQATGRHPRSRLLTGLAQAVPVWTAAGNRVLLTSRPYGLSAAEAERLGLPTVTIAELDAPLRELLVRRWFGVLCPQPTGGASPADDMLAHIGQRAELAPLVANPMLLTAMCVIFYQGKRLPRDKHDLYDRIVDNVLYNRYVDERHELPLIRNRLAVIAYGMHTGAGLDEERETPQAEATYTEIERMIQRYRDESPATEPGFAGAVEAREDLLTRSGVLLPRPDKRAGFYHFTFQDFLAAQLILEREDDLAAFFRRRAAVPEWRSTLSFVFSSLMARHTLPDKGIRLLQRLIETLSIPARGAREGGRSDPCLRGGLVSLDDLPLALVVADCLEILAGRSVGLRETHLALFRDLCLDAIKREVPLAARCELAAALGRLGDPRIVENLAAAGSETRAERDDPRAWCAIPVGRYEVGGGQSAYGLEPLKKQRFDVRAPFKLSRYPVTNSQFRVFLEARGYSDPQWWSEAGWKWRQQQNVTEPALWRDSQWNGVTQPVAGVSFYEAEAFCRWAGGRLPTEREWEAAVRGTNAYAYPWGNDWQDGICNTRELGLKRTTPVGIFPRSRSQPFGLEDAAGNVWEWCSDQEEIENYGVVRVVRGGSWLNHHDLARCVIRNRWLPDYRNLNLGFRVCGVVSPGLVC